MPVRQIILTLAILTIAPACDRDRPDAPAPATAPLPPPDLSNAHWPNFHADPALTGYTEAPLGDALRLAWRFPTGKAIKAAPALAVGRVYLPSTSGVLYALDLATGRELWRFDDPDARSFEGPPAVRDAIVYLGAENGRVYALDAATGQPRWSHPTAGPIKGGITLDPPDAPGTTRLYVPSYDSHLHCLDAATGEPLWAFKADGYINSAPARAADLVVFGSCDAALHVLDLQGRQLRAIDTTAYIPGSAALAYPHAFVGNYQGIFLCADVTTGEILWRHEGPDPVFATPALAPDRVVSADKAGGVTAFHRTTGEPLWTFDAAAPIEASPAIAADRLLLADENGRVHLLDLPTGAPLATFETGSKITAAPAIAAPYVLVAADDGTLYALDTRTPAANTPNPAGGP